MTFAFGVLCGIWLSVIVYIGAWAAWFYFDRILWSRIRAAEKAAPADCDVVILHRSGARQ
jgi:hypothetical protein